MGLSLAEAKKALGEKAFQQIETQVKSGRKKKTPAQTKLASGKGNKAENALYILLKDVFGQQYPIEREACLCKSIGREWRSDFVIHELNVCFEVDGWQFHGQYLKDFKRDRLKDFEVFIQGYSTIRIPATKVLYQSEQALEMLWRVKPVLEARVYGN